MLFGAQINLPIIIARGRVGVFFFLVATPRVGGQDRSKGRLQRDLVAHDCSIRCHLRRQLATAATKHQIELQNRPEVGREGRLKKQGRISHS